jgi:hypothetical protein
LHTPKFKNKGYLSWKHRCKGIVAQIVTSHKPPSLYLQWACAKTTMCASKHMAILALPTMSDCTHLCLCDQGAVSWPWKARCTDEFKESNAK